MQAIEQLPPAAQWRFCTHLVYVPTTHLLRSLRAPLHGCILSTRTACVATPRYPRNCRAPALDEPTISLRTTLSQDLPLLAADVHAMATHLASFKRPIELHLRTQPPAACLYHELSEFPGIITRPGNLSGRSHRMMVRKTTSLFHSLVAHCVLIVGAQEALQDMWTGAELEQAVFMHIFVNVLLASLVFNRCIRKRKAPRPGVETALDLERSQDVCIDKQADCWMPAKARLRSLELSTANTAPFAQPKACNAGSLGTERNVSAIIFGIDKHRAVAEAQRTPPTLHARTHQALLSALAIGNCGTLQRLSLAECASVQRPGFVLLLRELSGLVHLDLRDCAFDDWSALLVQIERWHSLQSLKLSGNSITLAKWAVLQQQCVKCPVLTTLLLPEPDADVRDGKGLPSCSKAYTAMRAHSAALQSIPALACATVMCDLPGNYRATTGPRLRSFHLIGLDQPRRDQPHLPSLRGLRCATLQSFSPGNAAAVLAQLPCLTALSLSLWCTHPSSSALFSRSYTMATQVCVSDLLPALLRCTHLQLLALGSGLVSERAPTFVQQLLMQSSRLDPLHTLCLGDGELQQRQRGLCLDVAAAGHFTMPYGRRGIQCLCLNEAINSQILGSAATSTPLVGLTRLVLADGCPPTQATGWGHLPDVVSLRCSPIHLADMATMLPTPLSMLTHLDTSRCFFLQCSQLQAGLQPLHNTVCNVVKLFQHLKEWDLRGNHIHDESALALETILSGLATWPQGLVLDLSDNPVSERVVLDIMRRRCCWEFAVMQDGASREQSGREHKHGFGPIQLRYSS
jgi:hypothetical protein